MGPRTVVCRLATHLQSLHSSTPPSLSTIASLLASFSLLALPSVAPSPTSVFVPSQTRHLIVVAIMTTALPPRTFIMICKPFKSPLLGSTFVKTELSALPVISALAFYSHALPSPEPTSEPTLAINFRTLLMRLDLDWVPPTTMDTPPDLLSNSSSPASSLCFYLASKSPSPEGGMPVSLSWICTLTAVLFSSPSRTHTLAELRFLNLPLDSRPNRSQHPRVPGVYHHNPSTSSTIS